MLIKRTILFLSILLSITINAQQTVVKAAPKTNSHQLGLADSSTLTVSDTVVVRDTIYIYGRPADAIRHKYTSKTKTERNLYVKTNTIGLAMLMINAAVEYQFHRNWSVSLPVYWSGWDYLRGDMKFRCLLFQPEVRYFPVNGLFVGIHAGTGWYNYTMPSMDYRYQDQDGTTPLINAGISVGYRHFLGFSQRWMMEYSMGGGYVSTSFDRFFNVPNGQLVDTQSKNLFLIDQICVSLVYYIPFKKKGDAK